LYFSPNIVRVVQSEKVKWAGLLASRVEMRNAFKFFSEILSEGNIWHVYMYTYVCTYIYIFICGLFNDAINE